MRKRDAKIRTRNLKERRSDEDFLYYALERDLDREAIFPEHDGWFSEVSFGSQK